VRSPIHGGFYVGRAKAAADAQCINLYLQKNETGEGKDKAGVLMNAPGLDVLLTTSTFPHRGAHWFDATAVLFVVAGNTCYSVSSGFVAASVFTLATASGPVDIVDNATYIAVCDGTTTLYVWNVGTSTLTSVAMPFTPGVVKLSYQDGFFLANLVGTQQFAQSNLNDPTTWNALNFSSADGQPDNVVTSIDFNRECWLLGTDSAEVWINAGLANFAFQRLQGVWLEQGCAAAYSVAKTPKHIVWLGRSERGTGVVWRTDGYSAVRMSTHALEQQFATYAKISDAQAYTYEQEGHLFYVITFPTGNETWAFDFASGHWAKRASFNANTGLFNRERANSFAYAHGRLVVGDYVNGNLYGLNLDSYTDGGVQRKWVRSWRALPEPVDEPMNFDKLVIDMERGITTPAGANPQVVLRWSDDGGNTWSNERFQQAGQTGETGFRVQFNRLGQTRENVGLDRIFELSSTDQFRVAISGAQLDVEPA
jgi:hypothetical protein